MSTLFPILLAFIAGLSTGIGSLIAIAFKKMNMKILSFSLGLSAGVMIYVSFIELLPHGLVELGNLKGTLYFFAGILFIVIIDFIIPEGKNPHHITEKVQPIILNTQSESLAPPLNTGYWGRMRHRYGQYQVQKKTQQARLTNSERKIQRMGIITALTIFLHNIPEGLITFMTASHDLSMGIMITFAVAIHNIPEGISVAMPIIYGTNNKKKAFGYSFLSGLAEPAAALLAALILWPYLTTNIINIMVVFTAGIMVYISLDEILPSAHKYCTEDAEGHPGHTAGVGVISGMAIMAISLLIMM